MVITELQPITVIFNVAEDDLPKIQEQLKAGNTLTVDAFDRAQTKKLATGTLLTVDNQIDPTTGTVKLKAVFTNADETLFPNQFVNARLLVDTMEDATLLPNTVIQRNADSAFVYLIKPDATGTNQTVAMQTITIGTTDGNVSAVEGIDPGTVVAADNFNKLTDGAKVMLRPANGGGAGRGGWHKKIPVSPSRPFILRPVATSLLMVAVLLTGFIAYKQLAGFRAAGGGLSDDPSRHVLSRRESRCFRVRHHRAAGTAVRPVAGTEPDDFDQLRRQLHHHAAIRAEPEH